MAQSVFEVDATTDASDADTGDGVCETAGGTCTLRAAIQQANAAANTNGPDEIRFQLSGDGPFVISLSQPLPPITEAVVVDGTVSSAGDPIVVLDGEAEGIGVGLEIQGSGTVVRSLSLVNFTDAAVRLAGSGGHVLEGNWIGIRPSGNGVETPGNGTDGVYVRPGSDDNRIGGTTDGAGNVVAYSGRNGVTVATEEVNGSRDWPERTALRRNATYRNNGLAIVLDHITPGVSSEWPVPNDTGSPSDDDDGPNQGQNYPEFTSFDYDESTNEVTVTFVVPTATTEATYPLTVEFFRTGPYGQAKTYLADAEVTSADAETEQTVTFSSPVPFDRSDVVVATATDADGRTSSLSPLSTTYVYSTAVDAPTGESFTSTSTYLGLRTTVFVDANTTATVYVRSDRRPLETPAPEGKVLVYPGAVSFSGTLNYEIEEVCFAFDRFQYPRESITASELTVWEDDGGGWATVPTTLKPDDTNPEFVCGSSSDRANYILTADPSDVPVELAGLDAVRAGERVRLTWQTASETNNAGFAVERSVDGRDFREVAFVNGAGTTTATARYAWTDDDLPSAASRLEYRLRQVDEDGSETWTKSVAVDVGRTDLVLQPPAPNPVRTATDLVYELPSATRIEAVLIDVLGRRVRTLASGSRSAGRHVLALAVSDLPSGHYFVRLQTGEQVVTERVTVVK